MKEFFAMLSLFVSAACNVPEAPIDADTRMRIDSLASERIREAKMELDTLCVQRERTDLPRIVDSIKREREREIAEKLKNIPQ